MTRGEIQLTVEFRDEGTTRSEKETEGKKEEALWKTSLDFLRATSMERGEAEDRRTNEDGVSFAWKIEKEFRDTTKKRGIEEGNGCRLDRKHLT